MRRLVVIVFSVLFLTASTLHATVFATVRGIVHDPQHHPVTGAKVILKADNSAFTLQATTDSTGEFTLTKIPMGAYQLNIDAAGFSPVSRALTLVSGTNPILHIPLSVAASTESVVVESHGSAVAADTVTPSTLVTREDIESTPGASRTLGMTMVTDYVPGSYMTHDMLHIRGGHQTSWLIDGIAIPNTKISSNVGPQIDPKDIDELETQRGSYGADEGDRTFGLFNVLPRNGFEFDHQGEVRLSAGNFKTGEAQIAFGDHSPKTAWYASATGARSDYGLAPPVPAVLHDATNSGSGFVSIIRNQTPNDQLRLDGQFRNDFFQVPYDPDPNDWQQASQYYQSFGLRDAQTERDAFVIANWIHTLSPRAQFSFAPYWHANQAHYDSRSTDLPAATTWHQDSNYIGGQGDAHLNTRINSISGGFYSFFQSEKDLFGVRINDGSAPSLPNTRADASAGLAEFYIADHVRLGRYITLLGGERISIYRAGYNETAYSPRIGATLMIPRLHWVLRGFYGHFFQPAPVLTVSSSVLDYVKGQSGENTFTPLHSENDEEHQFGISIPYRGWTLDVDTFHNRIRNFLDHSSLGESNMYFPIGVDGARVRAWELALRSPQVAHLGQFHLAYSNQIAQQRGGIVGGFTCSIPGDPACNSDFVYEAVDHDQRHTLNTGVTARLPKRTWFACNVYYGSGFVNGLAGSGVGPYQGAYLPAHTTFDVSAGHSFGESWRAAVNVLNVTNHRVLLDNSITIGGFHYNDPRMVSGELRYRFRF